MKTLTQTLLSFSPFFFFIKKANISFDLVEAYILWTLRRHLLVTRRPLNICCIHLYWILKALHVIKDERGKRKHEKKKKKEIQSFGNAAHSYARINEQNSHFDVHTRTIYSTIRYGGIVRDSRWGKCLSNANGKCVSLLFFFLLSSVRQMHF